MTTTTATQTIVTDSINATAIVRSGPRRGQLVEVHWSELGPSNELLYAVSLCDGSFTHVSAVHIDLGVTL